MSAFQAPFITTRLYGKTFLLETYAKPKTLPRGFAQHPLRCAFDASAANGTSTVTETKSYELLSGARIVTVQLPLDVYLEEATDGRVFIDELIPGGTAESSGLLCEGDVIVAVSLPFGEEMFPVSKTDGLDMIASHIESREDDTFTLAIIRSEGAQELRREIAGKQESIFPSTKMRELMKEIHIAEYPVARPDQDDLSNVDPDFESDLEALRQDGFNLDDEFSSLGRES